MADTIEYEQFEQAGANGAAPTLGTDVDLSRLSDIPMELSVEIGRTHMTVGETLDLRVGSVVALERLAGETADLLVNGTAIARGEVVVIDEQYGLRITEILDGQTVTAGDIDAAAASVAEPAGDSAAPEAAADSAAPEPAAPAPQDADAQGGDGAGGG